VGNDFSQDIFCKALWRMENAALTVDSKSTNTLSNTGVVNSTVSYKEGSDSAKLNNTAAKNRLSISSTNQCAGFPLKSGDTVKRFSGCCWFYLSGTPSGYPLLFGNAEWNGVGTCLFVGFKNSTTQFRIAWGYGTVQQQEEWVVATLSTGRWYHVGVVLDGVTKKMVIRIWDDTAQLATTYSHTFSNTLTVRSSNSFYVGCDPTDSPNSVPGLVDELVLFNRNLVIAEIDAIRGGTFSGIGYIPTAMNLSVVGSPTYFDPDPSGLNDFSENFSADNGQFTKFTENNAGSTSIANNKFTIAQTTSGSPQSDYVAENTSSFSMPQAFIEAQIDSFSGDSANWRAGVVLIKDADNFVKVVYESDNTCVHITWKFGGSGSSGTASFSITLTPPFKIGLSIVGNSLCAWYDSGSGWTYACKQASSTTDLRGSTALSGYMAGFFALKTSGTSTIAFSNFKCGRFGGVGLRDTRVVTNEDGTPYIDGTTILFTATASDPAGSYYDSFTSQTTPSGYCGVFSLDLGDYTITQLAVIMVSRSSKIMNDHAAHIIRHNNGDRRLFISRWGDGLLTTITADHKLFTTGDILSGTNVVSGLSALSLPTTSGGAGAFDLMSAYDSANSRWLIAYTTWDSGGSQRPALAYSTDLSSFTSISIDTNNRAEGTCLQNFDGTFWIIAQTYKANSSLVYDVGMNLLISTLVATFDGDPDTSPWPMVFLFGGHFYMLTFNKTRASSNNTWTWGQPKIEKDSIYSVGNDVDEMVIQPVCDEVTSSIYNVDEIICELICDVVTKVSGGDYLMFLVF